MLKSNARSWLSLILHWWNFKASKETKEALLSLTLRVIKLHVLFSNSNFHKNLQSWMSPDFLIHLRIEIFEYFIIDQAWVVPIISNLPIEFIQELKDSFHQNTWLLAFLKSLSQNSSKFRMDLPARCIPHSGLLSVLSSGIMPLVLWQRMFFTAVFTPLEFYNLINCLKELCTALSLGKQVSYKCFIIGSHWFFNYKGIIIMGAKARIFIITTNICHGWCDTFGKRTPTYLSRFTC